MLPTWSNSQAFEQKRLLSKSAVYNWGDLAQLTSFEFSLSTDDVHEKLDDSVHGSQCIGEEDEANDDRVFPMEAE